MSAIKSVIAGHTNADGLLIGATDEKLAFLGATPVVQRVGAAGAAIGAATYAAPGAAIGAATYAAPEAGAVNTGDAGSDTVIASLRTQLIALAADVAAHKTLVNDLRTQLTALAADVATHKTLANELRAAIVALGLHKGAA